MRLLKNIILFFLILILSAGLSYSNESIAYIDIDFIIKNSDVGKKTLVSLNEVNKRNIDMLKQKEKILKDLETEIKNKKNIISKENFDEEVKLFRQNVDEFKKEQVKMVKEFNDLKKKELDNIFNKISPIINIYMEKKSVKILLDSKNILIGRNDLNFTKELLDEINKQIK
jgi:outer membrane protein